VLGVGNWELGIGNWKLGIRCQKPKSQNPRPKTQDLKPKTPKNKNMRNFRELNIWQESIKIVKQIYEITALLPNDEKFGLKSQMQRAAVSISSNIAEGCSRNSNTEFKRFLEIAIGSSFELETQLIIIVELNMLSKKNILPSIEKINILQKMTNSFISKLSAQNLTPKIQNPTPEK